MERLRAALHNDLPMLYELAKDFNTTNLPANKSKIEQLIEVGLKSFDIHHPSKARRFFFVLESQDKIQGCCQILAQHGTLERPASYFRLTERQKYSSILGKHFRHQTLELIFDYDGPTELGGLLVARSLRGHPQKFGRFLSYARLAFVGANRQWFQDQIIAELLPALGPDGQSDLWPYLGARFTGLDYQTADKLSSEHIHFISDLFPHAPLYTALLPEEVRLKLGVVGPKSKPAAHLLNKVGFTFDQTIDPFDGGPTYRVKTSQCAIVQHTHQWTLANEPCPDHIEAKLGVLIINENSADTCSIFQCLGTTFNEKIWIAPWKDSELDSKEFDLLKSQYHGSSVYFSPYPI